MNAPARRMTLRVIQEAESLEAIPAGALIRLAASLDLSQAEPLCSEIQLRLSHGAVVLDGRSVERVGTPCLQVMAAGAAAARRIGAEFRLVHATEALRCAIADLALCDAIPEEV